MAQKISSKVAIDFPVTIGTSFKPKETLTVIDCSYLTDYAYSLSSIIKNGKSDAIIERKGDLRRALNEVVTFLYQFNINLTNLLQ